MRRHFEYRIHKAHQEHACGLYFELPLSLRDRGMNRRVYLHGSFHHC